MANGAYNQVTHVIFDMDGLLLDTETSFYSPAYSSVIERYGKPYTWDVKAQLMGTKTTESIRILIDALNLPITPEEFEKELTNAYAEICPDVNVMPGAEQLLHHLSKHNIPIALATSSSENSYDMKTKNWQSLFALFHHKVFGTSDPEVAKGKPEPDIFFVAAKRFPDSPDPSKCLVFEDSPNGVEAAIKAGMQCVMVPDPHLPKHLIGKATLTLNSLEDFKPETFGLPPYSD